MKKLIKLLFGNRIYTEADLISFGNYLLSARRDMLIKERNNDAQYSLIRGQVNDADLNQWKNG